MRDGCRTGQLAAENTADETRSVRARVRLSVTWNLRLSVADTRSRVVIATLTARPDSRQTILRQQTHRQLTFVRAPNL